MTKHPNVEFRKLVVKVRNLKKKKEIYPSQEQRKINWHSYTLSKINDIKSILLSAKIKRKLHTSVWR